MIKDMSTSVFFHGGTLVLQGIGSDACPPAPFRFIKGRWRCEAYHYSTLVPWFREQKIRDSVPRWHTLHLTLHEQREPHDYQTEALAAWEKAGRRGSIVLPTGAGKTFIAQHAIHRARCATVVVAPTIDLLHQWYSRLTNAFQTEIGVYYGGEKKILPLTVTTYHSAGDLIAEAGNHFKCIIFDEVHHLPAPSWSETALMAPAPLRLGLTATYPDAQEQTNGRRSLEDLLGPIVYTKKIDELVGLQLAEYRTERIRVNLTAEERERYNRDHKLYTDYINSQRLPQRYGPDWLLELMRRSTQDLAARRALLARQHMLRLIGQCAEKFQALEALLHEYSQERVLIFTEQNATVYELSRRFLIPAITHETGAAERKHILDGFREGQYRVIATSRVLNEGVDVPEAKIAVVLGGTSGAREYIQRLGRVLRKVENRQAQLFEIIARKTLEEGRAQRRRAHWKKREG
jgi:superfamily II DNA or RNA helicase